MTDGERALTTPFEAAQYGRRGREARAPRQLRASAWFFTALDDMTEAKLSAIVRKAAS